MSVEKNKKDIRERLLNARALPDDALDKVTGGARYEGTYEGTLGIYTITCSTEGCTLNLDIEPTCWDPSCRVCPFCKTGTLSYTFTPYQT